MKVNHEHSNIPQLYKNIYISFEIALAAWKREKRKRKIQAKRKKERKREKENK